MNWEVNVERRHHKEALLRRVEKARMRLCEVAGS